MFSEYTVKSIIEKANKDAIKNYVSAKLKESHLHNIDERINIIFKAYNKLISVESEDETIVGNISVVYIPSDFEDKQSDLTVKAVAFISRECPVFYSLKSISLMDIAHMEVEQNAFNDFTISEIIGEILIAATLYGSVNNWKNDTSTWEKYSEDNCWYIIPNINELYTLLSDDDRTDEEKAQDDAKSKKDYDSFVAYMTSHKRA